jgi:hypothetical protein
MLYNYKIITCLAFLLTRDFDGGIIINVTKGILHKIGT